MDDVSNAVKVMTVHSAKGLEFPVVFVAAMHKGVESSPPMVAFSRRYGPGARWRNPAKREREDKDDLFQHALREEWKTREQQESDRLLYVAMTRAEQHLVLSFSARKQWARTVADKLLLTLDEPGDRIVTCEAPDGKTWDLRVAVVAAAPELRKWSAEVTEAPAPPDRLLDPPAVGEQQDTNATVTALAKFAACPREYFLSHYVGFEGRPRKLQESDTDLPASELGTQVHALLAGTAVPEADAEAVRLAAVCFAPAPSPDVRRRRRAWSASSIS
ncbi:MAG: 3'-5' exonuclease [Ignavibacteriota bacterium]